MDLWSMNLEFEKKDIGRLFRKSSNGIIVKFTLDISAPTYIYIYIKVLVEVYGDATYIILKRISPQ